MSTREIGYYWVRRFGSEELQVACWGGEYWDFCGAESSGYAEPDDPTGERVRVVSECLQEPTVSEIHDEVKETLPFGEVFGALGDFIDEAMEKLVPKTEIVACKQLGRVTRYIYADGRQTVLIPTQYPSQAPLISYYDQMRLDMSVPDLYSRPPDWKTTVAAVGGAMLGSFYWAFGRKR